ncbi:MAG: 3'-5' exonuclease [Planctomycetia bacterium]|nr:3'-5' exonuclease [Planctomycetia bacterium]
MADTRYLVFDVESVADGDLVARLRYPGAGLSPQDAVARYRAELKAEHGHDFIPYTFQVPVCLCVAKVAADFRLMELVALDEPQCRPHVITKDFWRGWEYYKRPTLVSFNGRGFDIPLLELAAFRFGLAAPTWFNFGAPAHDQPRNRFNLQSHVDILELLTNFGSSRFTGGLNLAANLLGKPGKGDVQGHMVQDLYQAGELATICDYCRCDVLDTYFVFLRTRVMLGQISLAQEKTLIGATKDWLAQSAGQVRAYAEYLERWGDWPDPWATEG